MPRGPPRRETPADVSCLFSIAASISMLRRHLITDYKMTPEQHRQRWDLPPSYPLVAPDYAKTRSSLAKNLVSVARV